MNIVILGGTPAHRGGVEQFCDRAERALIDTGRHHIERVDANTSYLKIKTLGLFRRCLGRLFRSRAQPWDCVWLQYVNLPDLALLLICRLLGYTVLVTPHLGSNWSSQKNPLLRLLGTTMLSAANGIAIISPTQADELIFPRSVPLFHIKTFLPEKFPDSSVVRQSDGLALVHAGRLSDGKGSFLFLELCSRLRRLGYNFSARLIGSCDAATMLRIDRFLSDAELVGIVSYAAAMPEGKLLEVLCQADALIHLSEIDSFPLIVLEAIGCGVFPICRDLPGARFITEAYCGYVVGPQDAVGETMAYLIARRMELNAAASQARDRLIADYAWNECVALLETAISRIRKGGPAH